MVLNESDPGLKIKDGLYLLRNPQVLEHLMGHLLIKEGDTIKVLAVGQGLGTATVIKTCPEEVTLDVNINEAGLTQNIHLLIGASRPPTIKKIIEHGTAFGVRSFSFFKAELSEKSYLTSKVFEEDNLNDLISKGLAQGAKYSDWPSVRRYSSLSSSVSSYLEEAIQSGESQRFLMSLAADNTFEHHSLDFKQPITLAIGPERGWTKKEEIFLKENSFLPTVIGQSVLRVEIATFSALAQLAMLSLNR